MHKDGEGVEAVDEASEAPEEKKKEKKSKKDKDSKDEKEKKKKKKSKKDDDGEGDSGSGEEKRKKKKKDKKEKKAKREEETESESEEEADVAGEEVKAVTDEAQEAVADVAEALELVSLTGKEAVLEEMAAYLAGAGRGVEPDAVVAHLRAQQTKAHLMLKECAYVMVAVLLAEGVAKGQVAAAAPIFRALVATDANKFMARHLIGAVEDLFGSKVLPLLPRTRKHTHTHTVCIYHLIPSFHVYDFLRFPNDVPQLASMAKAFPLVLKQLYDEGVLSEEVITPFHRLPSQFKLNHRR